MTMIRSSVLAILVVTVVALTPREGKAHCDALDGPVVKVARASLESGKLDPVLAWVRPEGEAEVRHAFQKALAVRKAGPDAREVADRWFFETVVRVHRAGEGAPYTGLKAAGLDPGPAVRAADKSLESGQLEAVHVLVTQAIHKGVVDRFKRVRASKAPGDDVAAGREYVEAYVDYVHYVEGVYKSAQPGVHVASAEPEAHGAHHAH